jgi:hypothetical protein
LLEAEWRRHRTAPEPGSWHDPALLCRTRTLRCPKPAGRHNHSQLGSIKQHKPDAHDF